MRVFQLKKNNENREENDIFKMKIEETKKVNCIVVSNPAQSNCLCVINHLLCKFTCEKNIAHLIIATEDKHLKDITTFGSLNIGYEYDRAETNDNLEIDVVNIDKDREVDVLGEHFLIILPGGNIHIKLDEPESNITLQLSVDQQIM
ncbi:hypothetical protein [Clostridium lacusfryxellense]|uniref:hypothetical protein n=1 Tax=Clostridium lacusfryxellense TaxID=205328 RepID=UPI001C0D59C0|nr:hypothetical protein [Clostridium lacusfryxellense]MBU3110602.1 hypothetical protein [Clostridium lacusfryxellense]